MKYKKYLNPKRKFGSQKESSKLFISDDGVRFSGYQNYSIENGSIFPSGKLFKYIKNLDNIVFENRKVLDLGCSNGGVGFWIKLNKNPSSILLMDHDKECIENINKVIDYFNFKNVKSTHSTFEKYNAEHDIVITMSTIHWLYSATTDYGCLFKIMKKMRSLCKESLVIEWVDPLDKAIQKFKHLDFNEDVHMSSYSKENFIKAIENHFSSYQPIFKSTKTREVFLCKI